MVVNSELSIDPRRVANVRAGGRGRRCICYVIRGSMKFGGRPRATKQKLVAASACTL